ncbi:MAG: argininosuccinate synthase [Candidatus Poribacteria bacterium]|nr:argininosuccinate synthase [Candidatus Poribacteria bacterium]
MTIDQLKGKTVGAAVSGGLDSCTITRWFVDNGVNVVCFTADLGQPDERNIDEICERMLACGGQEAVLVDAKDELAMAGIKVIQCQAKYEGGYWNTTGIARHITVKALIPEMEKRGISILSHGCTGRGNDQVRFQLATNMLNPKFEVYAPWRDAAFLERFGGRKEMIDFCQERGLPITATHEKPYSTDANLLGLTHEAGRLESLKTPAGFITPGMGVHPKDAPDEVEYFTVTFARGIPVELNGSPVIPHQALMEANRIAGRNGVGIGIHTVENRFVGIKSRGVYESPGMELLGRCYEYLLQLILDRRARRVFEHVSGVVAEQIYQGYWFDPATQSLLASIEPFTRLASGDITVALYKGNVAFHAAGGVPHSLYSEETASMEAVGDFNHADSEGFLSVLGVSARALATAGQTN